MAALRQHRLDGTYDDSGWSPLGLLTDGVWPLLPPYARRLLRRPLGVLPGVSCRVPWVRLPLPDRDVVPAPPRGVSMASWAVAWDLAHGWTATFVDAFERDAAEWQIEPRHPLLDRGVIEFALALPEDQRRRGRITKFVLRAAAGLPAAIGARVTKADLGFSLRRALDALGGARFFDRLQTAEAGWVDQPAARRSYDEMAAAPSLADSVAGSLAARLWVLAAVELWFRVEHGEVGQEGSA